MPPACSPESRGMNGYPEETAYPSRTIAYQAAGMITSVIEALQMHDQLRYTPAFISNQTIVSATQQRLTTCMTALRDVSKATKCRFDDMELGYVNGPPAAQMSYERSRPQSPAMTPSRDLPGQAQQGAQHHQIPAIPATSPPVPHSTYAFMGTSRANTRPTNPFNAFSYPGTPQDLFLHTRGSPTISEDLWQNYDRGQLFPPEANGMGLLSPGEGMVDPALRQTPLHGHTPPGAGGMSMSDGNGQPMQPGQQHLPTYHDDPQGWAHLQANLHAPQHHDDQWSTGSSSGPIVRTTLNVGDWFEFFGIPNGDMNALGAGAGLANMVQQQHGNGEGGGGGYG
ncbi:Transcriptional activator of fatty acid utilization [Friedmanniomyces endolithicus]|uniref:Transcriptional activator of fatty acid utilization n=1 Tax=Friedmanniomyces endolithicus TaxID=329885 RepID=A0AAN6IZJ9_9PEZI|nr:Transcriptional activator of fatty acid utilization [Friedmanniomyces endolithicus]KAK0301684.1 Transcriptional activator of fatty acid utilization [Friedmanniomyces endolithicus]KAK0971597.1 Transcriptional activator of fatty acid utilization [Friedmanniomyces endolithicus]